MKSKIIAAALAFFLGGFGIHKFYLNKTMQGIIYLLLCWTFIPSVIAFFETFIFLFQSDETFNAKYNSVNVSAIQKEESPIKKKKINSLVFILLFVVLYFAQSFLINHKVTNDFSDQYNLSVKGGDKMEICVHAGLVAAAYNQAKDEENYLKWKKIEKDDCLRAGLSR